MRPQSLPTPIARATLTVALLSAVTQQAAPPPLRHQTAREQCARWTVALELSIAADAVCANPVDAKRLSPTPRCARHISWAVEGSFRTSSMAALPLRSGIRSVSRS